ncbi:TlyA family RNA methyltransferase [Bifidobacterium xylocopae]|uniref:TlyA family rRNA (Cytidine-2'-O)-methyltransferase n=1 Tax=Bifidobacterium xylocopae TaxID=2493119 RepID=A0A366KE47_9BIFI|nr:TlyA family RNA methyltransferase [Bifidobacterium xylocopae]RBP99980.1 TlyA family rRNA (cytidine-2'-O)-methyltransferase [Bifidobacterium xylocopae]
MGPDGTRADREDLSRLDQALVRRGLVGTRSRAAALVRKGAVTVDGVIHRKPSYLVGPGDRLVADKGEDYASRGAFKLLGAFEAFDGDGLPEPKGRLCLDIGASTGGFTDVLLRRGAASVIALDVGHDQLDGRLAADDRVHELSGVNIRQVEAGDLPYRPDYVVSDVSFISLTYVIPVIDRVAARGAQVILLVKPQFEVGRSGLGHGGVVRQAGRRQEALARVKASARAHGFIERGQAPSPIAGAHGNEEYLLWLSLD